MGFCIYYNRYKDRCGNEDSPCYMGACMGTSCEFFSSSRKKTKKGQSYGHVSSGYSNSSRFYRSGQSRRSHEQGTYYVLDVRELDIEEVKVSRFQTWSAQTGETSLGKQYKDIHIGTIITLRGKRYKVTRVEVRQKGSERLIKVENQNVNSKKHREGKSNRQSRMIDVKHGQKGESSREKFYGTSRTYFC